MADYMGYIDPNEPILIRLLELFDVSIVIYTVIGNSLTRFKNKSTRKGPKKPWECYVCSANLTKHGNDERNMRKCEFCAAKRATSCEVCRAKFEKREDTWAWRVLHCFQRVYQWLQVVVAGLSSLPSGDLELVQKQEPADGGQGHKLTPAEKERKRQQEKKEDQEGGKGRRRRQLGLPAQRVEAQ